MVNKYQNSTLQMKLLQIISAAMVIGTILAFSVVELLHNKKQMQQQVRLLVSTKIRTTNVVALYTVVILVQLH